MEFVKIWLATIALAVIYGIAHDMVTAHVCVEYFTIGHGNRIPTGSPILLALGWGTLATWWAGAILGILIAASARAGDAPRTTLAALLRPAAVLLGTIALASLAAGVAGYALARADAIGLSGVLAAEVPTDAHDRFMADYWAHTAAYGTALAGTLCLCAWIALRRWRAPDRGFAGATPPPAGARI